VSEKTRDPIEFKSDIDFEELKELFREYPYIASAYLFGSSVHGRRGPMSDVDIAILLKSPHPKGRELIHEEDYLGYKIGKALDVKEVDLIDLNSQGLVFQHNVLKSSQLLYDADPDFRIEFESRVISEYCDFQITLRFMEKFHLRGIKERLAKI
jgi:hypothetical protein